MGLKAKTINASLWSFAGNSGSIVIRFCFGIFLARILSPHDYGLTGMLAIFIAISDSLIDSGFSQALIQKKKVSPVDYCTIFFFNLFVGAIIFLILWFSSGFIADFFDEPILENMIIVLSFGMIIRSFTIVQTTLLVKELNFKTISGFKMAATFVSGILALPMAIKGFGVWSLVGLTLTQDAIYSLMVWIKSKWRPAMKFQFKSIRSNFHFGSRILAVSLLDNIFLHIYKPIIGKYFSAIDLGYYTRAYNYRELISKNLINVISSVIFPSVSQIHDQYDRIRINYNKVSELILFISIPLLLMLSFIAKPLIVFMITDKWLPSVPYLQVLCYAGLFYPISGVHINFFKAMGKANTYLYLTILHKITILISIMVSLKWGVMGLVYAQVVTMVIVFIYGVFNIAKYLNISMLSQLLSFFKYVLIAFLWFAALYFLSNIVTSSNLIQILIESIFGIAGYFFITKYLKFTGFYEFMEIYKKYIIPKLIGKHN